ncbi:MAG: hypothetical protein A2591_01040 [Candidatus Yonathbacteria bacterium RIFOXYD1_FULL_52_36]|uniref:Uncharacterized protein n=1 Tax=Candidatus Yonathbacteria bacterium RIFOXYD1_FULL_52_36 TaxID=1802730 RepID=A0A1G2SIU9_9BACT|nr:MAG: hypothetical protein A2591_01040 [Candidatus Yonathbacteria bacterium RIFOXYD1_FULL_52_36]
MEVSMNKLADDPTISGEEYLQMQVEKVLSPFNVYVTGKKLGREPTPDELAWNYLENNGAIQHAEENEAKVKV